MTETQTDSVYRLGSRGTGAKPDVFCEYSEVPAVYFVHFYHLLCHTDIICL